MRGKAIIFSAPSGAGKTTIVKHLLELDVGLEFSISACSRPPRENEVHGRDYYFMSKRAFREHITQGDFLEWEEVYKGNYYGTLKSELDRIWKKNRHVVFDVDVIGGLNLKQYFGPYALAVFVQPPSLEELETRLRNRSTDSDKRIRDRMAKAASEMEFASHFDVILVNDSLAETFKEGEKIVREFLNLEGRKEAE
jgi:guanylate kinase